MANRLAKTAPTTRVALPKGVVFCVFLTVPALVTGWMWSGNPLWAVAAGAVAVLAFAVTALVYRSDGRSGPGRRTVELYGGPLDGELLDLSTVPEEQLVRGVVTLPVRGGGTSRYAQDPSGVLRHVGGC
ncbi:hypothetical protein [Thermobifida cellulosilytica]|uniref:Uncharacterized protein n=1 Tax=Thermobifida cellulosilytica TB100 TaxID=665004 RepID=A0A147KJS5_THECS|nr:hypothetical protein [Thermobifida cellulosilytica]KUP97546.1 hypothetical protein AC529_06225 [Thermobifida cellulosilytica TB100]